MKVTQKPLILGYWNLRGKAQVIRLLLQYMDIPYIDQIHTPVSWFGKKKQQCVANSKWKFIDLPYLIDGDTVITQQYSILIYIIKKYGDAKLLGQNYQDQSYVDMYFWFMYTVCFKLISFTCSKKSQALIEKQKKQLWQDEINQKLISLQNCKKYKEWYLGYLSIIDFHIYELIHYVNLIYPGKTNKFKKLLEIQQKIGKLQKIHRYERSNRAVRLYFPNQLMCQKMKDKFAVLKE